MNNDKKTVWIAEFEYGKPKLAKAQLVKETEKQFRIARGESIFNWYYIPSVISKDTSKKVFYNVEDALGYLGEKCQAHVDILNKGIQTTLEWQTKMLSLLTELKNA